MSEHYVACKERHDGLTEWSCVSYWSVVHGDSRLQSEHSRVTCYTDVRQARRWAKRYGVECPTVPEPWRWKT
jgi:hypothetical protein